MITRFSVQPDDRRVLLGIDKANLFKAGVVYEATELLGEIILRPIGEYALEPNAKSGAYPNENSDVAAIMYSGLHLITKKEKEDLNKGG